jgi:hypothetical protein
MRRWILGVVFIVAAVIATGSCGTGETAEPTAQAVMGVWQARPIGRLDEGLASTAEAQCRARMPEAAGLPVALHDQRGDGLDTVLFADARSKATCQVVRGLSGTIAWAAGGGTTVPAIEEPALDDIMIDGMGSSSASSTGTVSDISGRVGAAIATVRILLDDGRQITATTEDGWFYAWWPGESVAISLIGDDPAGRGVVSATP